MNENASGNDDGEADVHAKINNVVPDMAQKGSNDDEKYLSADEPQKQRFIKMEKLVCEIGESEERFVLILNLMIRVFPEYLATFFINDDVWGKQFKDTVSRIAYELEPVLKAHQELLNQMIKVCRAWDSNRPRLGAILITNADYLKSCIFFLRKKNELCTAFKEAYDHDETISDATDAFESQVLNYSIFHTSTSFETMKYKPVENANGNSGMTLLGQFDMIHQNVVRYKLFAERYMDLIDFEEEEEIYLTKQAIKKLNEDLKEINRKLEEHELTDFVFNVYPKLLKSGFDMKLANRQLLKYQVVSKQQRNGLNSRNLILFSDVLLISHMDYKKYWEINLIKLEIKVEDGAENGKRFTVNSNNRSAAIVCSSKGERDDLVDRILQAQNDCRPSHPLDTDGATTFAPIWIPDSDATMCMMADCGHRFNFVQRRHHCRKCGYLICSACCGYSLLSNYDVQKPSKVCPACFFEILDERSSGHIKWPSCVAEVLDESVRFTDGEEKLLKDLFISPSSGKRLRGPEYSDRRKYLAEGVIHTKKGQKYARLTIDLHLLIFAARCDPQSQEEFSLQGYKCNITYPSKEDRINFTFTSQHETKAEEFKFAISYDDSTQWENSLSQLE